MDSWPITGVLLVSFCTAVGLFYNTLVVLPREMHVAYREAMLAFARAVEAKQPAAQGHSERVADLVVNMARRMRIRSRYRRLLEYAALLHDVGKAGIGAAILNKPEPLTAEEEQELGLHPLHSSVMLRDVSSSDDELGTQRSEDRRDVSAEVSGDVADVVKWHESAWEDVTAPARLKPLIGILAVAEAYETLTQGRSYRPAISSEEALERIKAGAGHRYCPAAVEALLAVKAGPAVQTSQGSSAEPMPAASAAR